MDIVLYCILGVIVLYGLYILHKHIDSKPNRIMFDLIENLRKEVRGGLDKNAESLQNRINESLKIFDQQFFNIRKTVDTRISDNTKQINKRLENTSNIINGIKEELGRVKEIGPQIKKLHEVLGGQKLRGSFGEQIMTDLISQIIPFSNYEFQYRFKTGEIVDAVIKTLNGLIPIDSKFPLENFSALISSADDKSKNECLKKFRRDIKKHINDISKKYILPEEGTMDFAFMYVPADSLFFEIVVNNPELNDYAQDRKIYIVSPSMFYSALQVILLSFQSQKFEKHAKEVLDMIKGIKKDSKKFGEDLSVLERHIGNAKNKMDEVSSSYTKLDTQINIIGDGDIKNLE